LIHAPEYKTLPPHAMLQSIAQISACLFLGHIRLNAIIKFNATKGVFL